MRCIVSQSRSIGSLTEALADGVITAEEYNAALALLTGTQSLYAERQAELSQLLANGTIGQEQYNALLERAHPLYEESIRLRQELSGAQDQNALQQAIYNQMLEDGLITIDEYNEAMRRLGETADEQASTMDRLADGAAEAFTNAIGDMLKGNKTFAESIQGLIGAIQDLVVELLILEPLKQGLKGLFGDTDGGGGLFVRS